MAALKTGRMSAAALMAVLAVSQLLPQPSAAAQEGRSAASTEHLDLEYPAAWRPWIEANLERLDRRYRMLSEALSTQLPERPLLRLWSPEADAAGIDPASRPVDGLLIPRLQPRRRIDLRLGLSASEPAADLAALEADLSLLLGAQLVAEASGGNCPAALALGAARYLQAPGEVQARLVAAIQGDLSKAPPWTSLMEVGAEYQDPERFQAWSLSLVHHLLHREGLAAFVDLLRLMPESAGWRDAFQRAYGRDPAQLEAEWRAGLAAYANGGWSRHLFYGADLSEAEARLAQGDYRGAAAVAKAVAFSWEPAAQDQAEAARSLADRATAALRARADLDLGLSLLEDGLYASAAAAAAAAQEPLAAVDDRDGTALAEALEARAKRGQAAVEQLRAARGLGAWRSLQAGLMARKAASELQRLGHRLRAREADAWARRRLAPLALLGALLTMGGLAALLRWLYLGLPRRVEAGP